MSDQNDPASNSRLETWEQRAMSLEAKLAQAEHELAVSREQAARADRPPG